MCSTMLYPVVRLPHRCSAAGGPCVKKVHGRRCSHALSDALALCMQTCTASRPRDLAQYQACGPPAPTEQTTQTVSRSMWHGTGGKNVARLVAKMVGCLPGRLYTRTAPGQALANAGLWCFRQERIHCCKCGHPSEEMSTTSRESFLNTPCQGAW